MTFRDSHHRLPNGSRHAPRSWVMVLVIAAILLPIAGIIWLLIPLLGPRETRTPTSQSTDSGPTGSGPIRTQPAMRPVGPTSVPVVIQPLPEIAPPPPRSEPELSLSVTDVRTRIFGVMPTEIDPGYPGLLAAPLEQIYCVVGLQLWSEIPEAFTIRFGADVPIGSTVVLSTPGGATYRALGQVKPVVDMVHPFDASSVSVSVEAGDVALQLVFLIPESLQSVELRVANRFSLPLRVPRPTPAAGERSLSGTWVKASRQDWRLRYQDPLLDAIRDENHTHLLVTEEKGTLRVEFPLAGITGTGSAIDGGERGTYDITLRMDDRDVTGVARFARQSSVLLLYLGAKPVYRFTYVRP